MGDQIGKHFEVEWGVEQVVVNVVRFQFFDIVTVSTNLTLVRRISDPLASSKSFLSLFLVLEPESFPWVRVHVYEEHCDRLDSWYPTKLADSLVLRPEAKLLISNSTYRRNRLCLNGPEGTEFMNSFRAAMRPSKKARFSGLSVWTTSSVGVCSTSWVSPSITIVLPVTMRLFSIRLIN